MPSRRPIANEATEDMLLTTDEGSEVLRACCTRTRWSTLRGSRSSHCEMPGRPEGQMRASTIGV
jgi:hypothetical protein